jgi:transposase-like protein
MYNAVTAIRDHEKGVSVREIARRWGKNEKAVSNWFSARKYYKNRPYGAFEEYILTHFPARLCAEFIPDKSINSLKIKRCRLTRSFSK